MQDGGEEGVGDHAGFVDDDVGGELLNGEVAVSVGAEAAVNGGDVRHAGRAAQVGEYAVGGAVLVGVGEAHASSLAGLRDAFGALAGEGENVRVEAAVMEEVDEGRQGDGLAGSGRAGQERDAIGEGLLHEGTLLRVEVVAPVESLLVSTRVGDGQNVRPSSTGSPGGNRGCRVALPL